MGSVVGEAASHQETARRPAGWPSAKPLWSLTVVVLALLLVPGRVALEYGQHWSDLGKHYLRDYLISGAWSGVGLSMARPYWMLTTRMRRGAHHFTVGGEAERVPVASGGDAGAGSTFRLTPEAMAAGAVRLEWRRIQADAGKLHEFLRESIYQARPVGELAEEGVIWGGVFLLVGLVVAVPQDGRARRVYREGRVVRGPLVVRREEFNRQRQGQGRAPGIGFATGERPAWYERLLPPPGPGYVPMVWLPREDEARHILLEGNTGGGKSTAIRQLAMQIAERGEAAIVYDPAREYVERFYSPERGDIILNPLDARAPYWSPGEEVQHDAEALTIAHGLFPDVPHENPYFAESVRKLFAHLLRQHPGPEELVEWLSQEGAIDQRVRGSEYAAMLDVKAAPQRSGVLSTLNNKADTLRMLRSRPEGAERWTAREWARERQGWIFLTSTPETRDALKPILSLWLDLLILRLLNEAPAGARRVWFLLDEVASLQKLPQLATALTENRKSNNPVVLGIQGKAQLESIYGHIAETMLSMPWTALFFKTTEPGAAEWVSRYLGVQEIERLRESRTRGDYGMGGRGGRTSKTYVLETRNRYAVLESQISGLPALQGYLKSGNSIVPLTLAYCELAKRHAGFEPRPLPTLLPAKQGGEPERAVAAEAGTGGRPAEGPRQGHELKFFE